MGTRTLESRAVTASTPRLRACALIALLAMFAFACVPTLSRALAAVGAGGPGAEICSAADRAAPASGGVAAHLDHCPLCAPGAAALALPMPWFDAVLRLGLRHAVLAAPMRARPGVRRAHASALPRAPPSA